MKVALHHFDAVDHLRELVLLLDRDVRQVADRPLDRLLYVDPLSFVVDQVVHLLDVVAEHLVWRQLSQVALRWRRIELREGA